MMNPATMIKIMQAKNKFTGNHPKFVSFLKTVFSQTPEEGTVIEVTVTRPNQSPITSNLKVQASDLELLQELKGLL